MGFLDKVKHGLKTKVGERVRTYKDERSAYLDEKTSARKMYLRKKARKDAKAEIMGVKGSKKAKFDAQKYWFG